MKVALTASPGSLDDPWEGKRRLKSNPNVFVLNSGNTVVLHCRFVRGVGLRTEIFDKEFKFKHV